MILFLFFSLRPAVLHMPPELAFRQALHGHQRGREEDLQRRRAILSDN